LSDRACLFIQREDSLSAETAKQKKSVSLFFYVILRAAVQTDDNNNAKFGKHQGTSTWHKVMRLCDSDRSIDYGDKYLSRQSLPESNGTNNVTVNVRFVNARYFFTDSSIA